MTKVYGIGLELKLQKDSQQVLWEDTLQETNTPKTPYLGIKFAIRIGKMLRPIKKFWKRGNPWKGQNVWFVWRIPVLVFPFLSIAFGNRGAYIGAKIYGADLHHYLNWMREREWGEGKEYLCVSASVRRTRKV